MKVAFSVAATDEPAVFRYLSALLWMCVDGRHTWTVEDVDDTGAIRGSAWRTDASAHVRDAVDDLLPLIGRRLDQAPDIVVELINTPRYDTGAGVWRLPPDVAAWHLGRPLLVIVENAQCDGAFVRLVMTRVASKKVRRVLGESSFDLFKRGWSTSPLGDGRWLEVRHGGGSTTATQLELAVRQTAGLPPRLVSFVDSDRYDPGDPLGGTAQAIVEKAMELNANLPELWRIHPFVLAKHEVENYLPKEVLNARFTRTAVQGWDLLSDVEKDHLDVKQHFSNDTWKVMIEPNYQQHLHERALRARCGGDGRELDDLAGIILSRL